ncbi:MAG: GNAT family N-acetyltransferase [Nitrososphaeria archaeon]
MASIDGASGTGALAAEAPQIADLSPSDAVVLRDLYPLYRAIFPSDEEAETLENLERYLALKSTDYYGDNDYHVIIARIGGKIVGFAIGDYYSEPSVGVIEFLGVDDSFRGRGLGSLLEGEFVRRASADASALGKDLRGIFVEVEDPEAVGKWGSVPFWSRRGYMFVPIRYVQPPLSPGKRRAENLRLMFRPIPESTSMGYDVLLGFLRSYFRYAMSIEDPERAVEYRLVEEQVSGPALTLEDPGSALIRGFSMRFFFVVDLYGARRATAGLGGALLRYLGGRSIPYVRYGGRRRIVSGDVPLELLLRERRDLINLRGSYLRHRSIIRFGPIDSFSVSVVRGDGRYLPLGDAVVLGTYKSINTMTLEVVIRGNGPLLVPTAIRAESPGNLRVDGERLESRVRARMSEILGSIIGTAGSRKGRIRLPAVEHYPLLIVESMEGEPSPRDIYGMANADGSYYAASDSELSRYFCGRPGRCERAEWISDLSVVDGILAMYEPRAGLVAGRSSAVFIDAFEEIYGIPLQSVRELHDLRDAMAAVEAEYSSEVEILREQFAVLSSIHESLVSWRPPGPDGGSVEEEYAKLTEREARFRRRMMELNALDVGIYESLREILRSAQARMGVDELRSTVDEASSALGRELDLRYRLSEDRRLLSVQFLLTVLTVVQTALAGITISVALGYSPAYTAAGAAAIGIGTVALAHRIMFRGRRG